MPNPPKIEPPKSWFKHLRELADSKNRVNWDIGDALVQGERVYKLTYRAASEATGIDIAELRDIASVARRVKSSVRTDKLGWSHHREVAALDSTEQVRWLTAAAAKEPPMSVAKLRDAIRQERRDRQRVVAMSKGGAKGCGRTVGAFPCCSVVHGDCRDLLPQLPTGAINAVITDPPYGVDAAAWDGRVPYELLPDFLRVASGTVVWFGGGKNMNADIRAFNPVPERTLIWYPPFIQRSASSNRIFYKFHPVYCWRLPNQHEGPGRDVLDINAEGAHWWDHPCTKPVELMRLLVGFAPTGGVVLDPFAGSGSTLVAAQSTGRHYLGFESNAKYVAVANARLAGVVPRDGDAIEKAA